MVRNLRRVRLKWLACLLLASSSASSRVVDAQTATPRPATAAAAAAAQNAFEYLKGLAGAWDGRVTTDPPNPDVEGAMHVVMRVAAQGNLLIHEMTSGDQPEPTMIFLDGDRLTLVHYCDAGNRPRLAARASPNPKKLDFDFVDVLGPAVAPTILQRLELTVIDGDHHLEDWTFKLAGDQRLRAHFVLTRSKGTPR